MPACPQESTPAFQPACIRHPTYVKALTRQGAAVIVVSVNALSTIVGMGGTTREPGLTSRDKGADLTSRRGAVP